MTRPVQYSEGGSRIVFDDVPSVAVTNHAVLPSHQKQGGTGKLFLRSSNDLWDEKAETVHLGGSAIDQATRQVVAIRGAGYHEALTRDKLR